MITIGEPSTETRATATIDSRRSVYLAGPIDHDPSGDHANGWRHGEWREDLPVRFFCPVCAAAPLMVTPNSASRKLIMDTNLREQNRAVAMVAYFDTTISTFGTPIEIWDWSNSMRPPVILVHRGEPGVVVRYLEDSRRVVLCSSFFEARKMLEGQLVR